MAGGGTAGHCAIFDASLAQEQGGPDKSQNFYYLDPPLMITPDVPKRSHCLRDVDAVLRKRMAAGSLSSQMESLLMSTRLVRGYPTLLGKSLPHSIRGHMRLPIL